MNKVEKKKIKKNLKTARGAPSLVFFFYIRVGKQRKKKEYEQYLN